MAQLQILEKPSNRIPHPDPYIHMNNWLFFGLLIGLIPNALMWILLTLFSEFFAVPADSVRYLPVIVIVIIVLSLLVPLTFSYVMAKVADSFLEQKQPNILALQIFMRTMQLLVIVAALALIIIPLMTTFGTNLGRLVIMPFFCSVSSIMFTIIAGNAYLAKVSFWIDEAGLAKET